MRRFVAGLIVGASLWGIAGAWIDTRHPAHERAERFVCEHPGHAYKAHGLSILPEACDR
jgi:hypothetical protein